MSTKLTLIAFFIVSLTAGIDKLIDNYANSKVMEACLSDGVSRKNCEIFIMEVRR